VHEDSTGHKKNRKTNAYFCVILKST